MQLTEDVCRYWDLRGPGFSEAVRHEIEEKGPAIADHAMRSLRASPGESVLDVGCGPGILSILLSSKGLECTGIDYSAEMINKARENSAEFGTSPKLQRMDAQSMTFDDCSFDHIVSRDVLWSIPDPEKVYREMVRILRPGGTAAIVDGNYYLHLFDDRYKKPTSAMKPTKDLGGHYKYNIGNVDFGIIEELAKSLPLSKEERPRWDIGILSKLPVSDISISFSSRRSSEHWKDRTVGRFEITFTKESDNGRLR